MTKGFISVGIAMVLSIFVCFLSPLGGPVVPVLVVSGLAVVVVWIGSTIAIAVRARRPKQDALCHTLTIGQIAVRILVITLVTAFVEEFVVSLIPRATQSFLAVEFAYYAVLVLAGVALAKWCRGQGYAPFVVAFAVLLLLSVNALLQFVGAPGVRFQFGPERWLFAMQQVAGRMAMLPLDVAFVFAAYRT